VKLDSDVGGGRKFAELRRWFLRPQKRPLDVAGSPLPADPETCAKQSDGQQSREEV